MGRIAGIITTCYDELGELGAFVNVLSDTGEGTANSGRYVDAGEVAQWRLHEASHPTAWYERHGGLLVLF